MWQVNNPDPVRLIVGILGANEGCMPLTIARLEGEFGKADLVSEVWAFTQTSYYRDQAGENILRQFVSFEKLIDPGRLADIKHITNAMEINFADELELGLPRPVNIDPGIIEPSKLVLASTKNFAHRIYIGKGIYAEVTLAYVRGVWQGYPFTFPDFKEDRYHGFLSRVRERLGEQLKAFKKESNEKSI